MLPTPPKCRFSLLGAFRKVDALPQFLAGLEMRHEFLRHLHLFAGLGVASGPRRAVVEAEAAESADLDALTLREGLAHRVEDHLDRELGILGHQLRKLRRQSVDQLRFGHCTCPAGHPFVLVSDSLAFSSAPRWVVPVLAPEFSVVIRCIASPSSALSFALIERLMPRFLRSMLMIIADTGSPSLRWVRMSSTRSRDSSDARRYPSMSLPRLITPPLPSSVST